MIYADLEPFDEVREDYRAAQIVQTLININRDTKRHPKPVPINECVLSFGDSEVVKEKPKKQTWQEQKMIAMLYAAAYKEKHGH
jgi:hypothetical protein